MAERRKLANNLPKFKAEFEGLKKDLDNALTELPNSKEIPSLLTSITSAGKSAGLDFLTFRPKGETPKEFYAEVPVDIVVSGPFFGIANFFVAVGNLPRIVNISNVVFSDIRNDRGRNLVKVNCQATTFRFLDKQEIKDPRMTKRRSNMRLISRGWLLFVLLLAAAAPGCKKKAPPPPPPQVTPLPEKSGTGYCTGQCRTDQDFYRKKACCRSACPEADVYCNAPQPPGAVSLDFTSKRDPFRPFVQVRPSSLPQARLTEAE